MANDEAIAKRWLSRRIKKALADRKAEGKPLGRRPAPQSTRQRIFELADSDLGPSAIARQLDAEGIPTPQGAASWRPSSVAAILKSR